MSFITEIKTFAALGSGVIGSGWVSRALAHGLDVVAWDRRRVPKPHCASASPTPGAPWRNKAWRRVRRKRACALSRPSKSA